MNRRDFLASLSSLAAEFQRKIEAECDGFSTDAAASAERVRRVNDPIGGYRFFAQTYFPHYCKAAPSVLHEYLFDRLPAAVASPRGCREAVAAPRGEAKSTLVSQIFTLWCVITGRKYYALIVMDSYDQAAVMLEAIKAELEANPRLKQDFPKACGQGRVWQQGVIVTAGGAKMQAAGSGKRLRGLRHGPYRPDLVVLDDLENDENVRSPEQRDKLESWLARSVLSLGAADDSMDVVLIGTILHYDSLLSRLLRNRLWCGRTFRAIVEWPQRLDLWERWEEALRNDGEPAADAYYAERRAEMDAGAVVSWPAMRPLLTLMKKRVRDGRAAFDSEQQNDPVNDAEALFARLTFWVQPCRDWVYFGAVDPSLGKSGAGRDPSAILVGGYDRAHGVLDVIEAQIARRVPDLIIESVIALHAQYRCLAWGVEAVQFQEFFRQELVKRSAARGLHVPARAITPHTDKLLRIESLQPHISNGLIRVHESQRVLIEQLRHYPMADHDDGPDALHMLWMLATSGAGAPYRYESLGRSGAGLGRGRGTY